MSKLEINRLIDELLRNGDIKFYKDEYSLVSLEPVIRHLHLSQEENENLSYIKSVEQDFRDNASDILYRLDLTHLRARHQKKAQ